MKALHALLLAATMTAATLAAPLAHAHAHLLSASPEAGATVTPSPKEITLTFNEKVEGPFSAITLVDSAGKLVATAKAATDAANPAILRLALPVLPAGAYKATWAVAGHDGHRQHGDIAFTVK